MTTTSRDHVRMYGFLRKELLSRYFALGRERRNDFFQESTDIGTPRDEILSMSKSEQRKALWQKTAARDNPWLFGSKLIVALASEARLGLPGADALLDRAIRSCERLFKFSGPFRGLPVRWDPVTSDLWPNPPPGETRRVCDHFLVTPDGRDYVYSVSPRDQRHFPYLVEDTGRALMGRRLFERYQGARLPPDSEGYVTRHRFWETSQDEMVGVLTTYVAAAEGSRDPALRSLARSRLLRVAEYLARHGYLMVMPAGGLAARGPGDALPALEWPFTRAIIRATGDSLTGVKTASFPEGLERAGIWELFRGPTDRAMAVAWATGLLGVGAAGILAALYAVLAIWSLTSWTPKFLDPGQIGFVAGIHLARDGFDVSNDNAADGMSVAALMHCWSPEVRFLNYIDFVANYTKARQPYSTGFVPFLGFLAAGGGDVTTANAYRFWLQKRRDRRIDDQSGDYSATCFASAVGLLLSGGRNEPEERELVRRLTKRVNSLGAWGDAAIVTTQDVRDAADYLAAVAIAWRYRQEREAAGLRIDTSEFPRLPPGAVAWPEPGVPRVVVETMTDTVPVQAIQGRDPPTYKGSDAPLFLSEAPTRPAVPAPSLMFPDTDHLIYEETFTVRPGVELFTGIVLRWGDRWAATAEGQLRVGGDVLGPEGAADTVWDARYPLHGGRDPRASEHSLLARLNNYVLIGQRRTLERWLYPEETFLYLRLNQVGRRGRGSFTVRVRVRGAKLPLKRLLEVGCVVRPQAKDRDRRLRAIGGMHRDGARWQMSLAEAIEAMNQGSVFFVRAPGVGAQELMVAGRKGKRYLKSRPDPSRRNNLSGLPLCG